MNAILNFSSLRGVFVRAFPDAELIKLDYSPGYDIGSDTSWRARARIKKDGKDRTCYLSTIDLVMDADDLVSHLIETWAL